MNENKVRESIIFNLHNKSYYCSLGISFINTIILILVLIYLKVVMYCSFISKSWV